jgi:hypothetical protein
LISSHERVLSVKVKADWLKAKNDASGAHLMLVAQTSKTEWSAESLVRAPWGSKLISPFPGLF